jgi:hypothetical protein
MPDAPLKSENAFSELHLSGQVLTITIAFKRQTHYGLVFLAETTAIAWKAGVVRVVLTL